jgi:tetratricopeptide (TPR) repeat protein
MTRRRKESRGVSRETPAPDGSRKPPIIDAAWNRIPATRGARKAMTPGPRSVTAGGDIGAVTTGDNSPLIVHLEHAPQEVQAHTVPYLELPGNAPHFTGREEELSIVLDLLDPRRIEEGCPEVAALSGLPGVGKSELALRAAHVARERGWCPGGVLFVDLREYEDDDGKAAADGALYDLILALGVRAERIPRRTGQRARLYRDVLTQRAAQGERRLVLLDNVSDPGEVRVLLPSTGGVVTSRQTLAGIDGVRPLKLDVLGPDDAVALVEKALDAGDGRMAEYPAEARELARLCGRLPLALRIAAALLAEDPEATVGELIAALADEHERLAGITQGDLAVRAAFDLSYERLPAQEARLFRLLSVRLGNDFSTETAAVIMGEGTASVRRGLMSLRRASLIDRGTVEGRWRLHDLISVYVADLARTEESPNDISGARDRLLRHYAAVAEDASQRLWGSAGAGASRFQEATQALKWFDAEAVALGAAVVAADDTPHLVLRLTPCLDEYLVLRRRFSEGLIVAEAAVRAARALWGESGERGNPGDGVLAGALDQWGRALAATGRIGEAVEPLQGAALAYRLLGDPRAESIALSHYALVMARLLLYDNATVAFHRAIGIQQRLGDVTAEATSLLALGETVRARVALRPDAASVLLDENKLLHVTDWAARAVFLYRRAGDRYGEGKALRLLGRSWADIGFGRSLIEDLATPADLLQVMDEGVENAHVVIARLEALNEKADELRRQGWTAGDLREARKAIRHLERSLIAFREYRDPHVEACALTDLSFAWGLARDTERETALLEEARRIAAETEDPHIEAVVLRGRGDAALRNGRFDDAASLFEEAARLFQEIGDRHEEEPTRNRLFHVLQEAGRWEEADAERNRFSGMGVTLMQESDGTEALWDGLPHVDEASVQQILRRVTEPFAKDSRISNA